MRLSRTAIGAEVLQWFGLLGAALVWTCQLLVGYGVTVANCAEGGRLWGLDVTVWEIVLTAAAGALVLISQAAAVAILLETRGTHYDDAPPWGRRHLFAAGAAAGNVIFLAIILMSGLGSVHHVGCRQA